MQPKTSVRPIIAGARRQQLSELLRRWRQQPRKRSPHLFWALLALALLSDCGLLFVVVRFLGAGESSVPRLKWDSWLYEYGSARQALYWSFLAVGFLAAGAMVRPWRPCCLFAGRLACLGCLVWSVTAIIGQVIQEGLPPSGEGSQGILWFSAVVMGLGLVLARLLRDGFLARTGAVVSAIGFLAANFWPFSFPSPWPPLPQSASGDICLRMQMWTSLSAYAALALAWGAAALALARILLAAPSSERLYRWATLCLWPIRIGVALLAASAILDGWWVMQQGFSWQGWNPLAMGTLFVLPGCAALLYARRRGWIPPFRLLAVVVLGFTILMMMWLAGLPERTGDLYVGGAFSADATIYMAGLVSLSLTTHAALRYYFGKQRIFVV
jgi:hypothetical protein